MTFILRPCALLTTTLPMLPTPSTPSVLPVISGPSNFCFSHSPFLIEAVAWGIFLARATSMAMACSAVVMVLPPGVFMTTMPFLVAAIVAMLSSPVRGLGGAPHDEAVVVLYLCLELLGLQSRYHIDLEAGSALQYLDGL